MKKSIKEEVLYSLENANGKPISGQELANKVGSSRAAIWKVIESLRSDGYIIDATQNSGYTINKLSSHLSKEGITKELKRYLINETSNEIHRPSLIFLKSIDSTNKECSRMISNDTIPKDFLFPIQVGESGIKLIIISNEQKSGRGRLGRQFFSPKDTGLYMSLVIKPTFKIENITLLTTMVSVVLCRVFEKIANVDSQIKWVNDIFFDDKKVAGILTEGITNFETGEIEHIILGIGINCFTKNFDENAGQIAGSLSSETFSRNTLAAAIIYNCHKLLTEMSNFDLSNPTLPQLEYLEEYKRRSMLLGKEIVILNTNKITTAHAIALDGSLITKDNDGNTEKLSSGEVSIRLLNQI